MAVVTELITKFLLKEDLEKLDAYNEKVSLNIKRTSQFASQIDSATLMMNQLSASNNAALQSLMSLSQNASLAAGNIEEISFTSEKSSKSSTSFHRTIASSTKMAMSFATQVGSMLSAVGEFTISTMSSLQPLIDFSKNTGIAIENVQELEYAATKSGVSSEELRGSLSNLSEKMVNVGSLGSFDNLGVSIKDANGELRSAEEVLLDVGQSLKTLNISDSQKANLASSLGIDVNTLNLITKSQDEISHLRAEAREFGVVTTKQSEQVTKFNGTMKALNSGLSAIKNQIAIALAPILEVLANLFGDLLKENQAWVVGGIKFVAQWIAKLCSAIGNIIKFIWSFIEVLFGGKEAAIVFFAAIALYLSPISATAIAIGAAIMAVIFIIDDLISAFKGGDSVIRDFFKAFFGIDIAPILQGIVTIFKACFGFIYSVVSKTFKAIAKIFGGFVKLFKGDFIGGFKDIFGGIIDSVMAIPQALLDAFLKIIPVLKSYMLGYFEWLNDYLGIDIMGIFSAIFNFIAELITSVVDFWQQCFGGLIKIFKGDFVGGFSDIFGAVIDGLFALPKAVWNLFKSLFPMIKKWLIGILPDWMKWVLGKFGVDFEERADSNSTKVQSITPNNTPNNSIQNQTQNINQHNTFQISSPEAQKVGEVVQDNLKAQLSDCKNQMTKDRSM